jgi:glutamine synthetase
MNSHKLSRPSIDQFGSLTFHKEAMKKCLSEEIFSNLVATMEGKESINLQNLDAIAEAMKTWAISLGATHYCHWFHPLTGKPAEKHDSFLDVGAAGLIIEHFSGKQLFKGEPDASSFPAGNLRKTAEARGYSSWDFSSLPFIWQEGTTSTLCIPSIFFSWTGESLDVKIPLIRAESKLQKAVTRLLNLLDVKAEGVYSTLGCEQEYFLVSQDILETRPDLLINGRTLFGAPSPRGQELSDRYFGVLPEKVINFMRDFEERSFDLGIPLKTRHSEVAPQQYEVAPLFERGLQSVDHNVLLMQLMKQVALKHDLVCLLHEKPFQGINGSGKHCNWSLSTDSGTNLLDPKLLASNPMLFLSCITAITSAVYRHSALLRASIASAENDHRLGGHEAPLALVSVYLGQDLEDLLDAVEHGKEFSFDPEVTKDIKISTLPPLQLDSTDRNRTSPFVFTGNKFEFRSAGSSVHPGAPMTVLNAIAAESFDLFVDQIESEVAKGGSLKEAVSIVLKKELAYARKIRYLGDSYEEEWKKEAALRDLPNIERSVHSFPYFLDDKANAVFEGILSLDARRARVDVMRSNYSCIIESEAKFMIELFNTQILPACLEYQKQIAKNVHWVDKALGGQRSCYKEILQDLSDKIEKSIFECRSLEVELEAAGTFDLEQRAVALSDRVVPKMQSLREGVDYLETKVQDSVWPLAKYREILFSL